MREAVIVDAVRTPIGKGKPGGALSGVHPVDLLAHSLRELVTRTGVDPERIDDVIGGIVDQVGEQSMNATRYAVLAAGLPESVPATTVDRQCGSSQQAVHFAAQGVIAGAYDIAIACGVESMSRVPMWSNTIGQDPFGETIKERYPDGFVPQGISAELIAAKWELPRVELDRFAVESHRRAHAATDAGLFADEMVALNGIVSDESIRPSTSLDVLAGLKPAFEDAEMGERFPQIDWRVTAGNSSPTNDGSAAVLVTTPQIARELGLTVKAKVHSFAVVGDDPILMLTGVIPATAKVLRNAGLAIGDIDLFEVNEAFASVVLAWQRETGADLGKVNVNGGAIALGHPLGASGARLTATLVNAMTQRGARYGLQTMCEAGGLANAMVLEAV
ncbi:MAG TPA: thiolase family protein [Solirubrobacteraceae bacterium]